MPDSLAALLFFHLCFGVLFAGALFYRWRSDPEGDGAGAGGPVQTAFIAAFAGLIFWPLIAVGCAADLACGGARRGRKGGSGA